MASIISRPNGTKYIQVTVNKRRSSIWLGETSQRNAERVRDKIEELVKSHSLGLSIPQDVAAWVAKLPKELMLYVKNMVFLDGAIARLAPDLDIIGELTNISMMFMQRHGLRLAQELGVNPDEIEIDMGSLKAGLGVDESVNSLTYRELQQRRDLINKRMRDHIRA